MRALTIRQPMASAIAGSAKTIENRPKRTIPLGASLPMWIGLHAGNGWWPVDWQVLSGLWPCAPSTRADYPLGMLLGVMRIDWAERFPGFPDGGENRSGQHWRELLDDPWASGPWCIKIGAVRLLDEPQPCRGQLGLWGLPEPLEALLLPLTRDVAG